MAEIMNYPMIPVKNIYLNFSGQFNFEAWGGLRSSCSLSLKKGLLLYLADYFHETCRKTIIFFKTVTSVKFSWNYFVHREVTEDIFRHRLWHKESYWISFVSMTIHDKRSALELRGEVASPDLQDEFSASDTLIYISHISLYFKCTM